MVSGVLLTVGIVGVNSIQVHILFHLLQHLCVFVNVLIVFLDKVIILSQDVVALITFSEHLLGERVLLATHALVVSTQTSGILRQTYLIEVFWLVNNSL